jgi:hypothetical protein
VDSERNPLKLKLYPTLRNATEGVYLVKGGNILKYRAKVNALSNPRSNHPSTTLTLQPIQTFEHKCKEKTPPLEICDEVQEEFIVVHTKRLTKHGSQAVKQVSKLKKIHKHLTLLELITWEKLQHSGIKSHLFYFP